MAKILYFVDPDFNTTRYDQAVGRIRRAGVIHSELHAVMVVVDETVHEAVQSYMTQSDKDDMSVFRKHVIVEINADPSGIEAATRLPTNEELKSTPAFHLKALLYPAWMRLLFRGTCVPPSPSGTARQNGCRRVCSFANIWVR
eukprot:5362225-Prymnesium_polylepis.1